MSRQQLPRGSEFVRGQVQTMRRLRWSAEWMVFSIVRLLLIVVSFQSWLDPFIISALPAGLPGSPGFLFITHTTEAYPHHGSDRRHGCRNFEQHFGSELCY